MNPLHIEKNTICDRYQITDILGEGSMGTTYAAIDLNSSQPVAIKAVSLRQTNDWKIVELFEREAKTLASIDHPFIPTYLDYFELDTEDDRRFYLVRELVEGKSLADLVSSGWHATETEVKDIAVQLLHILVYLHSRLPSIIHRDIKPQNIIRRQDGKVYLVDFGAVQDIYRNTIGGGKTFVGTFGYMSLEQLRGDVSPTSDLYSLGCSLLFLLTHRSPNDLPQKEMKLDFASRINVSAEFSSWLSKMVEPITEDRFASAQLALDALKQESVVIVEGSKNKIGDRPTGTKIILDKRSDSLEFKIPLGTHKASTFKVFPPGFWLVIVILFGLISLPEVTLIALLAGMFSYLSQPKKSAGKLSLKNKIPTTEKYVALRIDRDKFYLERTLSINLNGTIAIDRQEGAIKDIQWINLIGGKGTEKRIVIATQQEKSQRQYVFASGLISKKEAIWMVKEIEDLVEALVSE